ncbi:hypothetical protein [Streptomyces sp. NPDC001315]|uniref:beta-xylosidase family glycoside hydrolase n=1 Tax=Streptomyces sp. NPDC001315 TaxID=3364562 RepID=UPI0036B844D0
MNVHARNGRVRQCVAEHAVPPGPITPAVETRTGGVLPPTVTTAEQEAPGARVGGPDTIAFSAESSEGGVRLAELDGRSLSTQVAGGFTGRVVGMYGIEGSAAYDWFDHGPQRVAPGSEPH